ncbi:hypothetical protein [Pedobacter heparinus]|uniref:Uncharacterized protein n=1 Tax=Pedobacter heparinus (strain ATCC 13125 / DSM 2366 / CIP 104194 / JCM 7457 / NBRC 12017 / NCIMB 9290 / NRRL B-14731 / HIM 762-3) TaxID=485917 RepID=C6Y1S4_PEDHD|nr:hypothetical protein [Pedobacter heparinus]ACU05066.1 hypothetical protein Phep_2868 [Pedobacter heparinus DSM 2366]
MDKISKEADYDKVMAKINSLMAKGSKNVTDSELAEIRELALAAQYYEQNKYVIEAPTTLAGMIEMKMYELRLKSLFM